MSKMFSFVSKTWNPIAMKCLHECSYCWATALKAGRLKDAPRYRNLSEPRLIEKELSRAFNPEELVFVEDMGDLFGDWVPAVWIRRVLDHIARFRGTEFLLLTKNPSRYSKFAAWIPENCICGATIETNRDTSAYSKAAHPFQRWRSLMRLNVPKKFISIEPIMDFDLQELAAWIHAIPEVKAVAVGYDNYNHSLPEPSLAKTTALIERLERFCTVHRKTLREKQ